MMVAMVGFTLNDTITKFSSESMNVAQVMLTRGAFASLFVGLLAWQRGALARSRSMLQPLVAVRVMGEVAGTVTFLMALSHLPIANVSAVLQALPLAVTMGAALFFGEGVGWRRWLAIAAGFAGVLVIVRPGFEGFNVFSLLALVSVGCCAVRDLATRSIPEAIPSLLVSTATALAVTATGAVLIAPMGGLDADDGSRHGAAGTGGGAADRRLPVHHHGDAAWRYFVHRALPLHRADLVDSARLPGLSGHPGRADDRRRLDHRRLGPLHALSRADRRLAKDGRRKRWTGDGAGRHIGRPLPFDLLGAL
jgi:hypothetical protein